MFEETEKIKNEILTSHPIEDYNHNLLELKNQWENNLGNFMTIVSGKDYLIPILLMKTQIK